MLKEDQMSRTKPTEKGAAKGEASNLQDMCRFHNVFEICHPPAGKSLPTEIRQPLAAESESASIPQPVARESGERLLVDFSKHFHLGWTHYRILLGITPSLSMNPFSVAASRQSAADCNSEIWRRSAETPLRRRSGAQSASICRGALSPERRG